MKFLSLLLLLRPCIGDRPDTFFNHHQNVQEPFNHHQNVQEPREGRGLGVAPVHEPVHEAAHGAVHGVHPGFGQQYDRIGRQGPLGIGFPQQNFAQGTGQLELNSVECTSSEEEVCTQISETVCETVADETCFTVNEASCSTDIERQCININEVQCNTAQEQQCIT